jgi:amino acid adenylation domain-containing protein
MNWRTLMNKSRLPREPGGGLCAATDGRRRVHQPVPLSPAPIRFPSDRPRPVTGYREAAETRALPRDLVDALESLGGPVGSSDHEPLFPLLLAAFAVLLHRYSGEDDLLVGVVPSPTLPEAASSGAESCADALPVRISLANNPTFFEVLKRIGGGDGEVRVDPFRLPCASSRPAHAESTCGVVPCYQFMFHLCCAPWIGVESTLERSAIDKGPQRARPETELLLRIARHGRELKCTLLYNAVLFDAATAGRMLGHLEVLLGSIAANPGAPISALSLITDAERRQLIEEWNGPAATSTSPAPSRPFVHETFEYQALRTPDAVAIVFQEQQLTYRELDARSNQLAHALRRRGVDTGALVGICLPRSVELVVGLLGILKAGAAFIPLEPSYPADRLSALLADTRPALLVTNSDLLSRCRNDGTASFCMDTEGKAIAAESSAGPGVRLTEESLATVMFSSGSTGRPKAIPRSHRSLRPKAWARSTFQLDESDRHLLKTSLDSTLLGREVFSPLSSGGCIFIAGSHENGDTAALLRLLIDHQITIVSLVPSLLRLLVAEEGFSGCTSLRRVSCFGEPLPADVEDRFRQKSSAQLSVFYGTTEVPALACRLCNGEGPRPVGNLGHRLGDSEIYILDSQLQPVPIGVPGELFGGGSEIATGYLYSTEQTEERFLPHPFIPSTGARIYRTGDLARWRADGSLEFLGRIDDQLKIRGYRVEPAEVELALAGHPEVRESVVASRPDALGENQLVAFLVLNRDRLAVSELRAYLKKRLPEHMVPSVFARLPSLPRTPNGKVHRRALRDVAIDRLELSEDLVAPRTPVEERMADIWCAVLGVATVGINDNFFDLGGQSLLATRLLANVKDAFGVALTTTELLMAPTVSQLAATLFERDPSALPVLMKLQSGDQAPPFFCFPVTFMEESMVLRHSLLLGALARQIGPGYPFYSVTPGALAEDVEPARLIDVVADQALVAIRALRPDGPYFLGGYSLGGLFALEVARRLWADGEEVALLALLDTYGPGFPRRRGHRERIINHLVRMRSNSFPANARYISNKLVSTPALSRGRERIGANTKVADDIAQKSAIGRKSYLNRLKRYPGRITLFRASDAYPSTSLCCDDRTNGWDAIADEGVEVRDVDGDHYSMIDPKNLHSLAGAIRSSIQAACARATVVAV